MWHLNQMPLKLMTWRGDWHLFAASEAAEERLYRALYM
jgi:hypothetical protein